MRSATRGFTFVEMVVALVITAILMAIALPSFSEWIQNLKIRTAAESVLSGLQMARTEALKRNQTVTFYMTTSLDDTCAVGQGDNWVVATADPTGKCATDQVVVAPATEPVVLQAHPSSEGAGNVVVNVSQNTVTLGAGNDLVGFNGLGAVTPAQPTHTDFDFSDAAAAGCVSAGGSVRCLRIQVSPNGQARMCDPAVTPATDSRFCP